MYCNVYVCGYNERVKLYIIFVTFAHNHFSKIEHFTTKNIILNILIIRQKHNKLQNVRVP